MKTVVATTSYMKTIFKISRTDILTLSADFHAHEQCTISSPLPNFLLINSM